MAEGFIHDTAILRNTQLREVKLFRNAAVIDSTLGDGCSVGDDTTIERSELGNHVVINRRCYINDSEIGNYSYAGINTTMNWVSLGRFCSLGRNVDIGGFDHDYTRVTTMPAFRFQQMKQGGGRLSATVEHTRCRIGNDVWIAAGAQVLHKVSIGDDAVIGAGAVVTHDVPPYAIAVGVPAHVIGYRCDEKLIKELLEIQWWNWPENVLLPVMDRLMDKEISSDTIAWMKEYICGNGII